jgi:pimeloyl-ACP methyl ester carboxylesterase
MTPDSVTGSGPVVWPNGEPERFIDIDGRRFAYVEAGTDAPAVLLVHGSTSDYRSWQHQVRPFAAHFRTIAVSLRHCYPERWNGIGDDFTVERHADDLAAFIDRRRLGAVHLVGHSRGGCVALVLALRRPDVVRSLLLADPGGLDGLLPNSPEGARMAQETAQMFAQLRANLANGDRETAAREFVDALNGPGTWSRRTPEQRQLVLDNIETGPACSQRPSFTAAQIASLAIPVLVLTGARSPARYGPLLAAMRSANPHVSAIVSIPDAAHAMHRDNPAAFNAAVLDFLARH